MVRITNDVEGKVVIGLLKIEKGRQAENDGVHYVLTEMLGYEPLIEHNEDGKPTIEGYHISISHTIGYVAIILSTDFEVGIDIEYVSNRVSRIISRYLRSDEPFTDLRSQLIAWCAKETTYKLFSEEHLALQEMKVNVALDHVANLRSNIDIKFVSEVTHDYVLTYAWK